jgi:hypothetical protein
MRGGRTKSRTVGQRRAGGPVRGTRKRVRRAKRGALIVGAAKARKRAAAPRARRASAGPMDESRTKAAGTPAKMPTTMTGRMTGKMAGKMTGKTPRKARVGKR